MASHDTIRRALMMIDPQVFQNLQQHFTQLLNNNQAKKSKNSSASMAKPNATTATNNKNPNHIVSAIDENGFSIGQKQVEDKTSEIKAIPQLLDSLNIKNHIVVTIDALGTQHDIAAKIRKKRADYVLALKANQKTLYTEVSLCFEDSEFLDKCEYYQTLERARGALEAREYWHSENIKGLSQRKQWAGLKSVAMVRNTVVKGG